MRPPARGGRAVAIAGIVVALAVARDVSAFAVEAIATGGKRNGVPVFPFLMLASAAFVGSAGDLRVLAFGHAGRWRAWLAICGACASRVTMIYRLWRVRRAPGAIAARPATRAAA